ncbi:hypothetical protein [Jeongeupia naejangsanensis]|uniref:Uncharacterized protein n=1 Tax=Jeongeupia naejangsanensis TaxID=613195 RepID=A0ABS2BH22_9NEIS|nr:hypothetical protein [Jeongeupia naejangsanensis]MBM3114922.1 hypothetical protein [Jeongeupia naejangsanensis]
MAYQRSTTSTPPADQSSQPVTDGNTNPRPDSVVATQAEQVLLFLRPETGEVIGVPPPDTAELRIHYHRWSELVRDYHNANALLFDCEERLQVLAAAEANNEVLPPGIKDEADSNWKFAVKWRDEANQKLREEMKPLASTAGSGKKLVELIPLMSNEGDKPYAVTKKNEGPKFDAGKAKQSWGVSAGAGLKDHYKYPKDLPEKLIYVRSDRLKEGWPKFKEAEKTKWDEVYKKDANGKRKLDEAKLKKYTREQVKQIKINSKDFVKIDYEKCDSILGDWGRKWNEDHTVKHSASVTVGGKQVADIDLSAQAALMRYLYGGSLNATFDPFNTGVSFKAEGKAEISLAEAKAAADLYLPARDGILMCLYDLEGKEYPLGAIRLQIGAALSGVVGASIAAEVSLGVEMKDKELPKAKGKPGGKNKKRAKKMNVSPTEPTNVAGADAELNAFAGAKADVELKGAMQWRNPESKEKTFEALATIAPAAGAQAGIGASAKFTVQYADGLFKITAHASLCIGLGAEGAISLEVNAVQLASFMIWFNYQLYHANYRSVEIIANTAFRAAQDMTFLAIQTGQDISKFLGQANRELSERVTATAAALEKAEARQKLAKRILATPFALKHCPPETRGMLIYQLSRHGSADAVVTGGGVGDRYLSTQRKAILHVLRQAQTKADIDNIIQHIGPRGEKGSFDNKLASLKAFFKLEFVGNLEVPLIESHYDDQFREHYESLPGKGMGDGKLAQLGGDFGEWYDGVYASLKDEPTRGLPMVANNTTEYKVQRLQEDHPLFAATGSNAYYA